MSAVYVGRTLNVEPIPRLVIRGIGCGFFEFEYPVAKLKWVIVPFWALCYRVISKKHP